MTRSEARAALVECLLTTQTISDKVDTILTALEPCLTFTPEVVEMSAVCKGVGRFAQGE